MVLCCGIVIRHTVLVRTELGEKEDSVLESGMVANQAESEQERGTTPPYVSFLTFLNLFTWLEQDGVPHRFDRSFWIRKYSGSVGPQVLGALRFLRLLIGDQPQPDLERLVEAKGDDRKVILLEVLKKAYGEVEFEQLPRATPGMLQDWLGKYSGSGDTKRKVESFFINALKFVDYPLAPALKRMARNKPAGGTGTASPRTARKAGARKQQLPLIPKEDEEEIGQGEKTPIGAASTRTVSLSQGGDVSLSVNVDLFALSESERSFVLKLIDLMKSFGAASEED